MTSHCAHPFRPCAHCGKALPAEARRTQIYCCAECRMLASAMNKELWGSGGATEEQRAAFKPLLAEYFALSTEHGGMI